MILRKDYQIDAYVVSDIGLNKEKNEDNYMLAYSLIPNLKVILAVSDGVRNNSVPEIASKLTIEKLEEYHINKELLPHSKAETKNYRKFLIEVVKEVNSQILVISERIESYTNMAATLAISCITKNNRFLGLSVGDSSIFLYRRKKFRKICGSESINTIKYPQKYVIGISKELTFKVKEFKIERGDVYITATDGAVGNDRFDEEALNILSNNTNSREICNAFVRLAIAKEVKDNITVGVITVK